MPIFKPINENEASDKVKKVFEDIKSSRKDRRGSEFLEIYCK
tara:strand:+ start:205 stop:330 length:126 start_codon:yes stop_codon:yes gene_type:complete